MTPTGTPVYRQGNEKAGDHNLDALNLALVAFTLKISDFGKPKYQVHIGFAGRFGEISSEERARQLQVPGLVIKSDKRTTYSEAARQHLPAPRADQFDSSSKPLLGPGNLVPAANSKYQERGIGVWAWDGFLRDEPPPTRRPGGGTRRSIAPKRKTI